MKRVSNILNVFASHTSVHGLPNVILSRSVVGLSVWSTICFASVLIFIFQIADILHRYNEYPKKVVVENVVEPIDGLSSAPFPSITVCNMRHLDFRVLNAINRLLSEDENAASHVDSVEDVGRGLQFIRQYMRVIAKYEPLAHRLHGDQKYRNLVTELLSRTTVSANIPEEVVKLASVQRDDLFVTCTLRGNHCNMSTDFVSLFDPYYYNCFTYTAPLTERFAMSTAGAEFGWSSILLSGNGLVEGHEDLFQSILSGMYESRSALSASEGVRVVIHPPDTQPFPLAEGYDVPPGYSASFGVKPRRNERVGQPHGNCRHENPFESEEIYQAVSNVTINDIEDEKRRDQPPYHRNRQRYRRISCIRLCIQRHVIKSCHCYDSALPVTKTRPSPPSASAPTTVGNGTMAAGKNKLKADVKPCRLNDELSDSCMYNATDDCLEALMALYDRIECARRTRDAVTRNTTVMAQCGCHPPCEEFQYDVSYSLSKWPATGFEGENAYYDIFYVENFRERFGNLTPEKNATIWTYFSDENRQNSMKDFARLNVYIADSSVVVTKETADFEFNQLVSDIGGQLGIWVGISVITLSEVVELIYLLLRHSLSASRRFSGQSSTTVPSMPSSAVGGGSDTAWGNSSKKSSANAGKGTRGPANARCHSADEILNGKCSGSDYAVSRRQTMAATAAAAAAAGGKECCGVVLLGVGSKSRQVDEQVVIEEELSWIEYDRRYRPNEYMTYARHSGTAAGSSNAAPDGSALSGSGSGFTYEPIERDRSAMYRSYFSESSVS